MNGFELFDRPKAIVAGSMLLAFLLLAFEMPVENKTKQLPNYGNWEHFTTENGLPSNKTYCVRIDGARVLVGTHEGLAVLENGKWSTYTKADGLAHNGVLSIDVSQTTGDVWIGTMGGLTRWSAGRFETFTQLNSGMPNDLIYSVTCDGKEVWVATAGGAGKYDTFEGTWEIYTEQNAPMHEPWTYGISAGGGKIFIAAWGGGVVEYNRKTGQFRDYVDPDGNMEIDLFPDDGVVHDITTGTSWSEGYLWVATYFGLSRYDGVHWKGYFDHDSGLASNFINFIKASDGIAYVCTDQGLSTTNGTEWKTYEKNSISHEYVLGVDIGEDEIWVATSDGLSRGKRLSGSLRANNEVN
jgi:ligand-binding sensor domain-containing protein